MSHYGMDHIPVGDGEWPPRWFRYVKIFLMGSGVAGWLLLLIALYAFATKPAHAQTAWTNATGLNTTSTCSANGETWEEMGTVCHADKIFRQLSVSAVSSLVTSSSMPKCPDGYLPVLRSSGSPACARDIIDVR